MDLGDQQLAVLRGFANERAGRGGGQTVEHDLLDTVFHARELEIGAGPLRQGDRTLRSHAQHGAARGGPDVSGDRGAGERGRRR